MNCETTFGITWGKGGVSHFIMVTKNNEMK